MSIEPFTKEVREQLGMGWPLLVVGSLFITACIALYSLLFWTFTWWGPIFFGFTFLACHRYGTLLTREEKRLEKDG